jgi:hypothetical protein
LIANFVEGRAGKLVSVIWFITGPGGAYMFVYAGAAPLQRHPTVAVALVCVSVKYS